MMPSWLQKNSLPLPFSPGEVNSYLISDGASAALFDVGPEDPEVLRALELALSSYGLGLADIGTVVLSHYHPDHSGLASTLQQAGARVVMSRTEAAVLEEFLEHPEHDDRKADFHGLHPVPPAFKEQVAVLFPIYRSLMGRFTPDAVVDDGDPLIVGSLRFRVLLTPGHTPGHLALWHEDSGQLLSGDTLIEAVVPQISLRPDRLGGDPLGDYLATLERLDRLDAATAWPGHGEPIRDPRTCSRRIRESYQSYLGQIRAATGAEFRTAYDICARVFPHDKHAFGRWISLGRTIACLGHLRDQGKVEERITGGNAREYRLPE